MTDFSFANHGSITLLTPRSRKAKQWLNEHINEEAQYWGASVVIEPRRLPNHEVLETAKRAGATHAMAHIQADRAAREAEERDLIGHWNPPPNTHHLTVRRAG